MQDTTEVRAGISGSVLSAPVGTAAPTTTAAAFGGDWIEHGYLDDAGPTVQPSMATKGFKAWQELFDVRVNVTDRGLEYTFTLIQKNGENFKLAFGGGEVTDLGGGDFLYEPPATQFLDFRAFAIEVLDGDIIDRFLCERGLVVNIGKIPFKKDEPVKYDLTVRVLAAPGQGDLPWSLISNDPALADGVIS